MTATLHTDGDRHVLTIERRLPAPPPRVWTALTTPDGLAAWFPARVTLDLRVGGRMTFYFDEHDMAGPDGEVLELDEPERFAFAWGEDVLRFVVAGDGEGSQLTFTHEFADRSMAPRQAAGWEVCLDRLAGREVPADRTAELLVHYAEEFGEGTDGQVGPRSEGRRRLRFERRLAHPAERVWRSLTEPGELARWLAVADELDLRAGGQLALRWQNSDPEGTHAELRGTITEVIPPRVLEYELDVHGRLHWEVLGEGEGCLLTLLVDVPVDDDILPLELAGWHTHLGHLEDVLAGGTVDWSRWTEAHRPRWQEHHDRYAARLAGAGVG